MTKTQENVKWPKRYPARLSLVRRRKKTIRVRSCISKHKENIDNFEGDIVQEIFPF
jgi:hypothetical protein